MRLLDRKRPFGEICGNYNGARFEQDGALFDHAGVEIQGIDEPVLSEPVEAFPIPQPAPKKVIKKRKARKPK